MVVSAKLVVNTKSCWPVRNVDDHDLEWVCPSHYNRSQRYRARSNLKHWEGTRKGHERKNVTILFGSGEMLDSTVFETARSLSTFERTHRPIVVHVLAKISSLLRSVRHLYEGCQTLLACLCEIFGFLLVFLLLLPLLFPPVIGF